MKGITIWEAFDKESEEFRHNHIEDGWAVKEKPEPKFSSQKGWSTRKWRKEHAYLLEGRIISKEEGDTVAKKFVRSRRETIDL